MPDGICAMGILDMYCLFVKTSRRVWRHVTGCSGQFTLATTSRIRFSGLLRVLAIAAMASGAGTAWASLGASVTLYSGDPTSIYPGETTRLQITLSNSNTGSAINNVAFSNNLPGVLPNGLSVSGATSYSCYDPATTSTIAGSGILAAALGTQAISLSGGVVPARASNTDGYCTIVIPVTAGTSTGSTATYTYTIADGAMTGNDGGAVANSGAVNQGLNVKALSKPTISKSFGSSTLYLGGNPTTLTITLSNANSVVIPNFSITDVFPQLGGSAIIKVAASPNASNTCGASFSPSAGDTSITATAGVIPANGSCQVRVDVDGKQTNGAYSTGSQANTINASSQFNNDVGITAAANASANVTVNSPLGVSKSFSPSSLAAGQGGALTITLSNSGTSNLNIASFTDSPIDGISDAASSTGLVVTGTANTCAGTTSAVQINGVDQGVKLTGGTIPASESCTVTVNFVANTQAANTPVTYTNTIAAGAVDVGIGAIISQNTSATILVSDTLRVTKTNYSSSPRPGNPVQYRITVQNWSSVDMNDVLIQDTLPTSITYLRGVINGTDYSPTLSGTGCSGLTTSNGVGDSALAFTVGTVPQRTGDSTPGACAVTFYGMVSASAGNGISTVNSVSSVCINNGSGICWGGTATSANSAVNSTMMSANKTFDGASSKSNPEGAVSTLKITLSNYSVNALTSASISDTLPISSTSSGQMRIASPANAATTCGGSPTITATAGSTSISMNGATVPGRGSSGGVVGAGTAGTCFLQVDVVGPAGTYDNTATTAGSVTYADNTSGTVSATSNHATLTYTSALSATKSFNPSGVSSGGTSTVKVHLSNTSAAALSGVSVIDPLPTGMVVAPTSHAYTTCSGTTSVTATAGAGTISMSGADIAGFGSCDFVFDVVATGSSNWTNTIPVGSITASGGVSNQTAVTGTLLYQAPTNLTVAKATNPSTLTFPGQVSQLTITLQNGSQAVTGLHLTDYFTSNGTSGGTPNGMVVAATPASSTTCPGGIVAATAGGTSVGLSGVSLAASATCTVTVNVTSAAVGGITNYIPAGGIMTDQGLTNSGQASTSLTTQSNVGVTKQFTPNVVAPGERSRLRITFYNPTSLPMTAVAVTDTLPAGVTVPAGANPTTTCSGATVSSPASNQVQVSSATIPAASGGVSASCDAEIDVLVASQGQYVNTIAAGSVTGTSGGSSVTNSQPTSDTLRAKSPLTVHKAFTGKTLDSGNPVGFTTGTDSTTPGTARTLTIRLDNPNSAALTNAAFADTLPTGLVVATTPNASTTCSGGTVFAMAAGTTVRLAGGTIPAIGSCTVTVDVLSNISGSYTNTIPADGVTTDEGVSNAEATRAQVVIATPPTVAKQFSPAVIPSGGTSTLTIVLGNDNSSAITLSSVLTDTLPTAPGNIVVATPPNMSKTCPGGVTATAGSSTVSYASGATIPAGGCTISVDVTGIISGTHTNNIPAGALITSSGNNQTPTNATLTISALGYISGKVFKDNNVTPNGTYQSGTDTPISGASIELHSGTNCGGALVATTTTDSLGNYLFSSLAAGTYSVCEPVQPTATVNGITTAGGIVSNSGSTGTAGTASNPSSSTSQIVSIVLNGDGGSSSISGSTNNNFAEVVQSSISGTVFVDQNNNGTQNGADTGIAGLTLQLLDSGHTVVATTTTDANGNYSFSGLNPGTYSVREPSQPSGTSNGITTPGAVGNGGTAGTASGVTTLPSQIGGIVLPPNTASSGNNFAEIPNGRTVSGAVFLDYNINGVLNGPDHGIGGQIVNLIGSDINGNAVSMSATTASDGSYSFTGVPEGSAYTVTQPSQPTGTSNGITTAGSTGGTATGVGVTPSAISSINLSGGNTVSANNNFAEAPGAAPDLSVAKTHSPASFAEGGTSGFYLITPSNISPTTATSGVITIVDTLPAGITPTSASGSGWSCGIAGQVVTCTSSAVIAASGTGNAMVLRVSVGSGLSGQVLTNTVVISGGGEPAGFSGNNTATDPTPIATAASLSGHVWRDTDHNRVLDVGEAVVPGWAVELLLNGTSVGATTTDASGAYTFTGLAPGSGYQVRFKEPTSGTLFGLPVPNETGASYTNGVVDATANPAGATNIDGTLNSLSLLSGDNIVQQSLPLDPSGVVYDAVTRNPVSGAVVTLSGPAGFLAANVVGGSLTQTTGSNGYYEFLLLGSAPAGSYTLTVTTYPAGYSPLPSTLIPVCSGTLTVGATPNPALIQNSSTAPAIGVAAHNPAACAGIVAGGSATTQYYNAFTINPALPSANVVNNHIPLDPILGGAIVMTKTTPLINVTRGDLVPYTVTATNTLAAALTNVNVVDRIPPGFRYRSGSATLNGVAAEPVVTGRDMRWKNLSFTAGEHKTWKMILVVGSGVGEGEYTNQVWSLNNLTDSLISNVASAVVRIVPDPTFDCSDIVGQVFDDKNANGFQDEGEPGIANVRVVTARGLLVTTDAEGRFHVACAAIPQVDHGSNFVMKLDDRTLPTGYRLTTENPRDVRVTRGKMVKLNFGATVHRVVRLELAPAAFAKENELAPEWDAKLDAVIAQLKGRPSVLRIAYAGGGEGAQARLDAVAAKIKAMWKKDAEKETGHPLVVETEVEGAK